MTEQDLGGDWVDADETVPLGGTEHFTEAALEAGNIAWLEGVERPAEYFVDACLALRRSLLALGAKVEHPVCKELDQLAAKYAGMNAASRRVLAGLIEERDHPEGMPIT